MSISRSVPVVVLALALCAGACKKKGESEEEVPKPETANTNEGKDPGEGDEPDEGKPKTDGDGSEQAGTVVGKEVSYEGGGVKMQGYLAYDDEVEGKRPGVLVVHEWWGHNDYARMRARKLAEMGYTALAVDMYGEGKQAAHPDDAKKFMMQVMKNKDQAVERFKAAKKLLEGHETTDESKTAAIGYCFGGGVVLHMARTGVDLDGVASFHGTLATDSPANKGEVKAKVLVAHGNADPFVPAEQVETFKKEMESAGVDLEFHGYDGAKHAFTNPGATEMGKKFELPLEYDEEADEKSWAELEEFLKEIFEA